MDAEQDPAPAASPGPSGALGIAGKRDDLDGLFDDETIVEDPNLHRAKAFLFGLVLAAGGIFILIVALFFRPEGQVFIEHWPNGYRRTQTNYVSAPNQEGRIPHGPHKAWYEDGTLAEQGTYERGEKVGEWRYWDPSGSQIDYPR